MPLNQIEKDFFNKLQNTKKTSSNEVTIESVRESMQNLIPFVDSPSNIKFTDKTISSSDGNSLRLRVYRYDDKPRPLIIYLPGNAFIFDLFEANHVIISKIAHASHCHAVMVDYRLAPEHPYPIPLQDAKDAVTYIFSHLSEFQANPERIILCGFSSGANLAAVITNTARKIDINIYHQFLISGAYDYTNSLHEYDEFAQQDKLLSPDHAQYSFNAYCNEGQRKEATCSPYWEKDLTGLPPTTIMVAEYDGGRSQSEGYAKKLKEAGNRVNVIVLSSQTHGTILFRKALYDGKDPALVAAEEINKITD